MSFNFKAELYQGKNRKKYLEAEKRIKKIHKNYPEIKKVDEYLNYLQREYNYYRMDIFHKENNSDMKLEELKEEIEMLKERYSQLLDQYDIPRDYKEPQWDCELCHDTGRIYKNGKYILCNCAIGSSLKSKREISNIPRHLYQASFKTANLNYYDDNRETDKGMTFRENAQKIYSHAQNFTRNYKKGHYNRGLIIEGPIGSGKSFLLGCIANDLIKRNIEIKYIVYTDLLQEIRDSYEDSNGESELKLISSVQEIPVLLIDDLGTEKASEFASNILYQIIDKRYREERPIILSTNFSIQELQERFSIMGERIFQRLLEMNRYFALYDNIRAKLITSKQEVQF